MISELVNHRDSYVDQHALVRFSDRVGAGIGGTFFALFAASASLGKYYPWLLPMNVFVEGRFAAALWLGIGGGILAALLGCLNSSAATSCESVKNPCYPWLQITGSECISLTDITSVKTLLKPTQPLL